MNHVFRLVVALHHQALHGYERKETYSAHDTAASYGFSL